MEMNYIFKELPIKRLILIFMIFLNLGFGKVHFSPMVIKLEGIRGTRQNFSVSAINSSDNSVFVEFIVHDFDITERGQPIIADSVTERSCAKWIKLDTTNCTIQPHEQYELKGTIEIPIDAAGGYYSIIQGNFRGSSIEMTRDQEQNQPVQLATYYTSVLILEVPSSRARPKIVPDTLQVFPDFEQRALSENPLSQNTRGWKVLMGLRNDGQTHAQVSGFVSFWSEAGVHIESAKFKTGRGFVMPGKVRHFEAFGNNTLMDGYYMMRINFRTDRGRTLARDLSFAAYNGEIFPGAKTEELDRLLKAASPGFNIRNPFIQKTVTPGGKSFLGVVIQNITDDTLNIAPQVKTWNMDSLSFPVFGNSKVFQPRTCENWISFDENMLTLDPGQRSVLKLWINVPSEIEGEYYSAIFLDQPELGNRLTSSFPRQRTQLICLRSPESLNYNVALDSANISIKNIQDSNTGKEIEAHNIKFNVWNRGNVLCFVNGKLNVDIAIGAEIYKKHLDVIEFGGKKTILLPDNKRTYSLNIPKLEPGKYRLIFTVSYKDEIKPYVKYQPITIK